MYRTRRINNFVLEPVKSVINLGIEIDETFMK